MMPSAVDSIARVADAFALAAARRAAIAPVRDRLGSDLNAAYEVQELGIRAAERAGDRRVGRKVGLTSRAVQRQLGVSQPDFGVLLESMDATGLAEVPSVRLLQPRIEAEVAFILERDVVAPEPEEVLAAVGWVTAALEIVDSRVRDWDIGIADTVADNASSGMFVLGESRRRLDDVDPREVTITLEADGVVVSEGSGVACLGDPRNALVWVAETAHRLGRPLRAGEVILSGALGPMVPFGPGTAVTAHFTGLGSVSATASKE